MAWVGGVGRGWVEAGGRGVGKKPRQALKARRLRHAERTVLPAVAQSEKRGGGGGWRMWRGWGLSLGVASVEREDHCRRRAPVAAWVGAVGRGWVRAGGWGARKKPKQALEARRLRHAERTVLPAVAQSKKVGAVAGRGVRSVVVSVGGDCGGWRVRMARAGVQGCRPACAVRCGVSGVRGGGA